MFDGAAGVCGDVVGCVLCDGSACTDRFLCLKFLKVMET